MESIFTVIFLRSLVGGGLTRAEQRPIETHGNEFLEKLRPRLRSRVDGVQYKGWHSAG